MKLSSLFFLFSFQVLDLMKEVTEDKGSVEEEDGGNGSEVVTVVVGSCYRF